MTKKTYHERMTRVVTECLAAGFATRYVLGGLDRGEFMLPRELDFTRRDIRDCSRQLELTYLLRLFAVFEGALRGYWTTCRGKPAKVPAEILVNSVGARHQIPSAVIAATHKVREERNLIVHHDQAITNLGIVDCKSALAKFLSFLPQQWWKNDSHTP